METQSPSHFEAIVISSGVGGMAAASFLARVARKRILVLERHRQLGGLIQTFSRDGWSWDIGLQYIGEMEDGTFTRRLLDLATSGQVEWIRLPYHYDCFEYPDLKFAMPSGARELEDELSAQFPEERRSIQRYLKDARRAYGWFIRRMAGALFQPPGPPPPRRQPVYLDYELSRCL